MKMKFVLLIICLFFVRVLPAQKPVTIECRIGEGIGKIMQLSGVNNGQQKILASASYAQNGYYGFRFIPEYEGFYVLGDGKSYEYPLYLKAGDAVSLFMDKDTIYLTGKNNTTENKVLYDWVNLSKRVCEKSIFFTRSRSTYEDFFPEFEVLLSKIKPFCKNIETKNSRFNELMKHFISYELDRFALNFIYTPRSKHPSKEQRIAYYNSIVDNNKFQDEVILEMPDGIKLMKLYMMFYCLENKKNASDLQESLVVIPNRKLQGTLVVEQAKGFGRSYFEYMEFMEKAKKYVDADQLKILEDKASELYEAKKGERAIDFTCPDANGKMHSLSDYKGKVVVVDVWATWCGPCRAELPHLKKLEKAMEGKDVVFIGVSVDEKKNYEKWKKFLVEEQLPGVQLFADGWSKITKDYKITGIPRFMVFAKDGSIVESHAPRPSDPSLQDMIESELRK